jgi:hypothetical protein
MKKYLLTFCDSRLKRTLDRITNEAIQMNVFDKIFAYDETKLDEFFLNQHGQFIKNNKRGYGYWLWKSYLIIKTLKNEMNENDILVYVDGGCTFNINEISKKRMNDYFEIVSQSNYGIISFELDHKEKLFTKNDLFLELECEDKKESFQLNATAIIMRKCDHVFKIMEKVFEIATKNNYHFLDDSPSFSKNDNSFIDHRHDQSIMSLIRKKYGSEILKDETWCQNFLKDGLNWPIWATRKKY